ncbi:MAG: PilZ domain-containing protein [Planctomycetia bacterium]|nr:PilZ domain-containing protein [Planctomycetia bacterium]
MAEHQPRGGYYTVINPKLIEATVLPREPERPDSYAAELREISPTGAKLLVTALPELEYECRISLASPSLDCALVALAEVHWIWPNLAGDWLLGCGINPPLSDASFKNLLDSGLLERRFARREPIRIPVQVQLQPGEPRVPATVHDLSDGGVCLTMRWTPPATRDVCIFASVSASEVRIPLKLRWSTHVGLEYFVGCEVIRYADILLLRKMQPTDQNHFDERAPLGPALAGRELPRPA